MKLPSNFALAGKLFGGTAIAQVAALAATTVAAVGGAPEEFARYAAILAVSGVISSGNSLAVESRIPVVDDEDSAALMRVGTTVSVAISLVILLVAGAGLLSGATWSVPGLCIAVATLATSAVTLVSALAIRLQVQNLLARNRVVQGVTNALLIVVFNSTSIPLYLVLTGSWITSTILGCVVMIPGMPGVTRLFRLAHRGDLTKSMREVRSQPITNIIASFGMNLPPILLPMFGASALAGAWALISRILNALVNTIYQTTYPVYSGNFAKLYRDRDHSGMRAMHTRWLLRLGVLIIPMVLGTIVGVWWLIPLLGNQWLVARSVILPACLSFPALMVWLPMGQTLLMVGRTDLELLWTVGNLVASSLPLLAIPWIGGFEGLTLWAVVQVISLLLHIAFQRHGVANPRVVPRRTLGDA